MNFKLVRAAMLMCCAVPLLSPARSLAGESESCGPGTSADAKSIVFYSPGPQIASAAEFLSKHQSFLREQMGKGAIESAGPLVASGMPTGRAVLIYRSADASAVRAVVQTDPMVVAKVFTYDIGTWLECRSAKA